ncbi:DUF397 domain-containing protein [Streptomyces sp. Ncost-T10-10d]|uniref:DUF397 domain-containing protein n=1 Tax=Streptomyces sp. Ncost-T10-10d TaxID=1839774 RepID=UPI000B8342EE
MGVDSRSSGSGDDCVEVATCPTTVHVRDSKVEQGHQLALSPAAQNRLRRVRRERLTGLGPHDSAPRRESTPLRGTAGISGQRSGVRTAPAR